MKRLSILFLFLCAVVFLVSGNGTSETASVPVNGAVTYLAGDVLLNGNPAVEGASVKTGDKIQTGPGAFCEVVFNTGNVFTLEENTIASIDWGKYRITLDKGAIASVFDKLKKIIGTDRKFTIVTPSAAAGIRGTVFYIKVEDPQNTYVCTCNGELSLSGGEKQFDSPAGHHKAFRFTKEGTTVRVSSAKLLYHDDAKMDALAADINQTIPWSDNP